MKNFTTLIKESFEIYKQKIKPILILLMIFVVGAVIFGVLVTASSFGILMVEGGTAALLLLPFAFGLVFVFLSVFINFSLLVSIVKPAGTTIKEIFQEAWKKVGEYFWIMILVSLFVILSSLFLVIPGIIVAVYLMFSSYVFIAEGEKGMDALKRSWALVKNNWWKVFGRLILLNIILSIICVILGSVNDLLGTIFQYFCMPLNAIFLYLIYLELKRSKEIQAPTPIQV